MTAHKEYQNKEEVYSSEDRKILVSLLNEYSGKLLDVCGQLNKIHESSIVSRISGFTGLIGSIFFLLFDLLGYKLHEYAHNDAAYIIIGVILILTFISSAILLVQHTFEIKPKLILVERDATVLVIKLEKLIRVASQAEEHIFSNVVSKIEIDLRLADAESAVQHYRSEEKRLKTQSLEIRDL
jgi:low affinity Fe/Cu permease